LRVRLGGDDAAQLSSPARGHAASLPRPVQLLNFAMVLTRQLRWPLTPYDAAVEIGDIEAQCLWFLA
jgi:hypothetical protein